MCSVPAIGRSGVAPIAMDMPRPMKLHFPPFPKIPKSWRIETGGSFSSPVVAAGKLAYIDGQDSQEVAHLVDTQNGKELWRVPSPPFIKTSGVPAPEHSLF